MENFKEYNQKTKHAVVLALHYTDIMHNRSRYIQRSIHAGVIELYYYRTAVHHLVTLWFHSSRGFYEDIFLREYAGYIQRLLNRTSELRMKKLYGPSCFSEIHNDLFNLSYDVSIALTKNDCFDQVMQPIKQ